MKTLLIIFSLLAGMWVHAQQMKNLNVITPDNKTTIFTFDELVSFPTHSLDSLRIINQAGMYRSTLKKIEGVLLKDVVKGIALGAESPKVLSEYYIVCMASDEYKVVLSWNELFNTPVGESVMIVTNIKEATHGEQEDGLALLSPKDIATGRRYVKQLRTIKFFRISL